jgi:predicted GTPase
MDSKVIEKLENEQIVRKEPAMWVDSATVMQNGRLILTTKHLVFMLNDATSAAVSIDLDTINSITNETILTDHNILHVDYLQYDTARFSVLNYEEWEKAIEDQRMKPSVKSSEDNGEE